MSEASTVALVESDLRAARAMLQVAQEDLIRALESGVKLSEVRTLEETVAECTAKYEDLSSTKTYVVGRERERIVRDSKKLSTVLYIARWGNGFSPSDVTQLVFDANAKNEANGITGLLILLRGWFASWLEGEETILDKTLRSIAKDRRCDNFAVLRRESNLPPATPRLFPEHGLALRRLNGSDVDHRTSAEAAILQLLCNQLGVTAFVPRPILSKKQAQQLREASRQLDDVAVAIVGHPEISGTPMPQCLMRVCPNEAFWTSGRLSTDMLRDVEAVMGIVKAEVEDPNDQSRYVSGGGTTSSTNPDHHRGCVGQHGSEGVTVAMGANAEVALQRTLRIYRALSAAERRDLFLRYAPTFALHFGDIEVIMDGVCTFCGPAVRYLRILSTLARQEGHVILCSEMFTDEVLMRKGLRSAKSYIIDKRPDEVFVPDETSDLLWTEIVRREREEAARQLGDRENEGGVSQAIADIPMKKARKPKKEVTAEEYNAVPVPGLATEAELRTIFDSLGPGTDGTIPMSEFSRLYYAADTMGVTEYVGDMEREAVKLATAADQPPDRVTFDQFCVIWYRRLKG